MKQKTKYRTLNTFYFIFILFGMSLVMIDPLIPIIAERINAGYDKIGIALLIGSLATFVSNFAAGRFSDYVDIKKLILLGLSLLFTGYFIFGIYLNYVMFILVFLMLRVGYGTIDTSVHSFSAKLFNQDISNIFIRLDIAWFAGAFLGPLLISAVLFFDFKIGYLFFIIAFFFAISIIIFYRICPSRKIIEGNPAVKKKVVADKEGGNITPPAGFLSSLKNPVVILTSLILFFYSGSITSLSTWLTTYFLAFGIKVAYSSAILSLYWLISIAGLFAVNKLLRKFSEATILLTCFILGTICFVFFSITGNITAKIIFFAIQALFFAGTFSLLTSITARENSGNSGTVLGANLAFTFAGSIIFQPLLGFIAEYSGEGFVIFASLAGAIISLLFIIILFRVLKKKVIA
ncbi:MAG: MFS transporter [Actinobacteria bacterium]|nr:MFS transporter [Actinomycetota bacterium]